MYQPKVSTTQKHSDNQGEHLVCEGKLILLKEKIPQGGRKIPKPDGISRIYEEGYQLKPIIFSETEELKVGDRGLYAWKVITWSQADEDRCNKKILKPYKILALPEHFSDKHLQAIADEKMKSGDSIYLKTEWQGYKNDMNAYHTIHLNQQNHITIFPVKQSLESAIEEFFENNSPSTFDTQMRKYSYRSDQIEKAIKHGAEWAKKNNY